MVNCCTRLLNRLFNVERKGNLKNPVKCCNPDTCSITIHLILFTSGFMNYFCFGIHSVKSVPGKLIITTIFLYLVFVQVRAWLTCSFIDPGYILGQEALDAQSQIQTYKQQSPSKEALNTYTVEQYPLNEKENQQTQNIQNDESVKVEEIESKGKKRRFCEYCQLEQEQNVYHCDQCGYCIRRYDHHCPFLGNCIGERNYRYFYKFCIYATISAFFSLLFSLIGFLKIVVDDALDVETSNVILKEDYNPLKFLVLIVGGSTIFIFSFLGACFPFGMCVNNVCGLAEELNEIEKEIPYIDPETQKVTTKNITEKETVKDILGPNWGWFLLRP